MIRKRYFICAALVASFSSAPSAVSAEAPIFTVEGHCEVQSGPYVGASFTYKSQKTEKKKTVIFTPATGSRFPDAEVTFSNVWQSVSYSQVSPESGKKSVSLAEVLQKSAPIKLSGIYGIFALNEGEPIGKFAVMHTGGEVKFTSVCVPVGVTYPEFIG